MAYLSGESLPETGELRDFLAARLPEYMVPAVFVPLDALPLTTNGKVDRRALPAPEPGAGLEGRAGGAAHTDRGDPGGHLEGAARPGAGRRRDRFFELGGHSLLATQVLSRVRQTFGVEISLRDVFESPTVAGLAERIDAQAAVPAGEDELAALLDELDMLSDDEALARFEDLHPDLRGL